MRIITGNARGKRLTAPEGLHTRPTTERTKESIFNIIQFDIEGRRALDLFAGSGQMGLEAVSRGAAECVFVDSDRKAQVVIKKNIATCGMTDRCRLETGDAYTFLQRQKKGSFGLIFLDPPYGGDMLNRALELICQFDILTQGGIIVCESARDDQILTLQAPYQVLKEYHYGNSKVITVTRA